MEKNPLKGYRIIDLMEETMTEDQDETKQSLGATTKRKKGEQSPAASFEEAIQQLTIINSDLQSGKLPLDEALKKYEDAIRLREYATKMLAGAKLRITVAGEEKGIAAFRMRLNSLLSEFEEEVVELFRAKKDLGEVEMMKLLSRIKALFVG